MEPVKISQNSQIKFDQQVNPSGRTNYFVSLLCRQIDFQKIFTHLSISLSLNHAGTDSESWQVFLQDKLPLIKDKFDLYSIHYRRTFINFYDAQIN